TGSTNINSLSAAKPFVLSGGTLGIATTSTISSTLTHSGGTLQGTGAINVSGLLTWTSGVMQGSGITTANGGMSLNSDANLDMDGSRALINSAGQTATFAGSAGRLSLAGSSTFTNNGTLNITTTG